MIGLRKSYFKIAHHFTHKNFLMPICPWPQLIVFAFGAGSSLFVTALVGCIAYNGKFGDDNKFRKYSYGWDTKFGQLCVANVSLAMFTICFVMLAIFFNIKHFSKGLQIAFWVITDVTFIGLLVSQGLSIEWSKYGDALIPSKYDYFNDKKFKDFVVRYYEGAENKDYTVFEPCNSTTPYCSGANTTANVLFNPYHMPYLFSNFSTDKSDTFENHTVPQCWINWKNANVVGIDPCNWVIKDGECIGGWKPESFKNYWCYAYRHKRDTDKKLKDMSDEEIRKYYAVKERVYLGVDSYDAFYEINNIFIGLECSGFGLTTATLFILLCVNPFDKEKIHFKKIEASGSGSEPVKPTRKGGSSGSGSA